MIDFLRDLYHKLAEVPVLGDAVVYLRNNLLMAGIIFALVVFIIVILCVMGSLRRKAKKAAKAALKEAQTLNADVQELVETESATVEKEEATAEPETPVTEELETETKEPEMTDPKTMVEEEEETEIPPIDVKPVVEVVEETVEEPVVEVVEETVEEPVVEVVEETVEEPIVEVVEETVEEPVVEVVEDTVEEPVVEVVEDTVEEPIEEVVEETVEEPVVEVVEETVEEPVVEVVEETVEEPVVEVVEETVEEPVEDTVEEVIEDTVEEVAEPLSAQAQDASETIAMIENMDDEDNFLRDHYDENETDRLARHKGKWAIFRAITNTDDTEEMYFFELQGSKEETLLSSEEYSTYQGVLRGIQTYKTNILKGNLKTAETKNGEYTYKLLSGKNMLLCVGDNYPTKAHRQSAIDSIVRFAETAIEDENLHDIVIKVPHEDSSIEPVSYTGEGKWIISTCLNENGVTIYSFNLFNSDGDCLLSSEEYTTYVGAVNGIQTYKRNLALSNFKIMLTRRGDYTYKLLNANGQLLYLGERFLSKQLCANAVEEIKYFSANSPILQKSTEN